MQSVVTDPAVALLVLCHEATFSSMINLGCFLRHVYNFTVGLLQRFPRISYNQPVCTWVVQQYLQQTSWHTLESGRYARRIQEILELLALGGDHTEFKYMFQYHVLPMALQESHVNVAPLKPGNCQIK